MPEIGAHARHRYAEAHRGASVHLRVEGNREFLGVAEAVASRDGPGEGFGVAASHPCADVKRFGVVGDENFSGFGRRLTFGGLSLQEIDDRFEAGPCGVVETTVNARGTRHTDRARDLRGWLGAAINRPTGDDSDPDGERTEGAETNGNTSETDHAELSRGGHRKRLPRLRNPGTARSEHRKPVGRHWYEAGETIMFSVLSAGLDTATGCGAAR